MLGYIRTSDTSHTGLRCLCTTHPALYQLAKEGPDSVAPVVIPALAPSLDRSLKGDRSLCPVRALRYYLDRTSGRIRRNWSLSPSRKGLTKTSHLPPSPHGSNRL